MATIDNLTIEINADTKEAERKIKDLASALSALKNGGSGLTENKLSNIANGISSIRGAIGKIQKGHLDKIERLAEALTKIGNVNVSNLAKAMKNINKINEAVKQTQETQDMKLPAILDDTFKAPEIIKHLPAIQNVKTALGEYAGLQEEFRESAEGLKNIGRIPILEEGREFYGSFREVDVKPLIDANEVLARMNAPQDISADVMKLQRQWSFFTTAGKYVKSFVSAVTPEFAKLGKVIRNLLAPIKGFIRSIGRIALYRAIRGLIKSISAGIKEGVDNLAMFSMLVEEMDTHKANRVMSLYTSNFLYLKNAIATAVIPVFKALEPVIDAVIKKTIEFINIIAQLTSVLSGSTTYTKAKYYYVDYAKSLDKASGSASKLNKQLAQFDELNNLTTSGGSGSGTDLDYLKMFEDPVPIEDWILNLKNANWRTIAETLSEKFRNAIDNIDWESVKAKIAEGARKLAGLFNGIFTPENFKSVSRALAQAINTAFTFLFNLGEELDAYQAGKGVTSGLTEFLGALDTGLIANTLNVWAQNLKEALKGAVDGLKEADWKYIFSNLWKFFENIKFDTVKLAIGIISVVTITKIGKWVFGSGILAFLGTSLAQYIIAHGGISLAFPSISAFISKVSFASLSYGSLATVAGEIGAVLVSALSGYLIGNGISQIFYALTGDEAMLQIAQQANPFTSGILGDIIYTWFDLWLQAQSQTFLTKIGRFIVDGVIKGVTLVSENVIKKGLMPFFTNFFSGICAVFGIASPAKEMYPVGKNIVLGIIGGITTAGFIGSIETWYNDSIKPWFSDSKWKDLGNNIKNNLSATLSYSEMWKVGNNMGSGLYNAFSSNLTAIWNSFVELKNKIANNPIVQTVKTVTSGGSSATQYVASAGDSVKTLLQLANDIEKQLEKEQPTISSKPSKPAGMPDSEYKKWLKSLGYAHGGYPSIGSLFVAGEAGAELVGNFNGRTGVANTDQIEEAMYQATYDAMSKALSENGMNVTIEGDVDNMFRVMQRRASDFYTRTGRPAF